MRLYVGGLPYQTTENDLISLFEQIGQVTSVTVITDRETGRSKGFGFVEMSDGKEAEAAINALNGNDVNGRQLTVNEARPREDRGGSSRSYSGNSGGSGARRY